MPNYYLTNPNKSSCSHSIQFRNSIRRACKAGTCCFCCCGDKSSGSGGGSSGSKSAVTDEDKKVGALYMQGSARGGP